jgi:hypothetical protein
MPAFMTEWWFLGLMCVLLVVLVVFAIVLLVFIIVAITRHNRRP